MGKKREKILKGVIFLLAVVMVCEISFIVVDKFLSKEKIDNPPSPTESPEVTPVEEPEKEFSMKKAEELYDMIYDYYGCGIRSYKHYGWDKVLASDFTNKEKNALVIQYLYRNEKEVGYDDMQFHIHKKFTKEQIIKAKNIIFGEDISFEIIKTDGMDSYQFQLVEDGNYVAIGWSDTCTGYDSSKLIKAVKKGDKVYIDQAIIFGEPSDDYVYINYYQDYERTKQFYRVLNESNSQIDVVDYLDKASIYRYTYQDNKDGTYTFLQMERVK